MKKQICLASPDKVTWQTVLFRQLPLKTVTKLIGRIMTTRFPYPLNLASVKCFAQLMKIDMNEAEDNDLKNYKSISQLFTRKLRTGIRSVNTKYEMVSFIILQIRVCI